MPEAAMHLDSDTPSGENDIRLTGKIGAMEAKTKPEAVKVLPHNDLGFCMLASNLRHHATTCRLTDDISHKSYVTLTCPEAQVPDMPPYLRYMVSWRALLLLRLVQQRNCQTACRLVYRKRRSSSAERQADRSP